MSADTNQYRRNPAHFLYPQRNAFSKAMARVSTALRLAPTPAIRGTDESKWQTKPFNAQQKYNPQNPGSMDFMIAKATEATSVQDAYFSTHWKAAHDQGAPAMVYHFFRSNLRGDDQADFCLNTIAPLLQAQGSTAVWCDIETRDNTSNATRIARVYDFLTYIDNALPGLAGVYSSPYFWSQLMTPVPTWISAYNQWVAHWTSAATPSLPAGWSFANLKLWQYGIWDNYPWVSAVPGMQPDVDVNWAYFDTRQQLATWLGISGPPPQTVEQRLDALEVLAADHEERISALENGNRLDHG